MKYGLALLVLIFPGWAHAQETKPVKRPNILWITCEDMGPHLGCYGDKYADTPNLDKFAKRALRYTKVWSNAPVCAPARTTIISGMYPPSTGSEHMRSNIPMPEGVSMVSLLMRGLGYYCTNHIKEDYNLEKRGRVWDDSSAKAHWKNRAAGQPFFAVFNLTITHESQIRTKGHKLIHDPAKAVLPPYHPDTPEVRHDWAQYYDNITTMDRQFGKLLAELEAAGLLEETIVIFFSDHGSGMPRNKRTPLDCGLHVPMLVHVPQNYQMLASKDYIAGGTSPRLVGFVDLAPTLLSLAGEKAPTFMQGRAFLGTHPGPENEYLFGFRGRMDERYDFVRSVRDQRYVYVRNFMPHRIAGQHVQYMFETPTTRVWKKLFDAGKLNSVQSQFWQPRPAEELYDLQADPHEVRNLAGTADHEHVQTRLRLALREQMFKIRDVGLLPEDEMHRRAMGKSPFHIFEKIDPRIYVELLDLAHVASDVKASAMPRLKAALESEDAAHRYWACVGLFARGKEAVLAHRQEFAKRFDDAAPCVRIIAAEALGTHGDAAEVDRALAALVPLTALEKNSPYVVLQSLNTLDELGNKVAPVWPALASAGQPEAGIEPRLKTMIPRLVESIRTHQSPK